MKNSRPTPLRALVAGIVALAAMTSAGYAGDDDARDQELVRKALLEGRILSLSDITEKVKPSLPGEIIGVELEVEDGGRIVYEFNIVDTSGKLKEVEVDAATGNILKIEDDD